MNCSVPTTRSGARRSPASVPGGGVERTRRCSPSGASSAWQSRSTAAIAGSAYAEIDAGHVVFFEKEDEFVKTVTEFLGSAAA
ncbi:hypothetical protein ABZ318_17265 [Streptomyces sp. NPDC006197]|uniref:hypothetical protein n=1 Tax=Streptomyces sp. NPDC006197 TaxID=3156685 RepID=UPI0033B16022